MAEGKRERATEREIKSEEGSERRNGCWNFLSESVKRNNTSSPALIQHSSRQQSRELWFLILKKMGVCIFKPRNFILPLTCLYLWHLPLCAHPFFAPATAAQQFPSGYIKLYYHIICLALFKNQVAKSFTRQNKINQEKRQIKNKYWLFVEKIWQKWLTLKGKVKHHN